MHLNYKNMDLLIVKEDLSIKMEPGSGWILKVNLMLIMKEIGKY